MANHEQNPHFLVIQTGDITKASLDEIEMGQLLINEIAPDPDPFFHTKQGLLQEIKDTPISKKMKNTLILPT